jgi:hypothetical protein
VEAAKADVVEGQQGERERELHRALLLLLLLLMG